MSTETNKTIVGKVLHHFENLHSTNDVAAEYLSKSTPVEGTVIITDNQYQGKGQHGSFWVSAPYENLTFSTILYPNWLLAHQQFLLNQITSLAIHQVLEEFGMRDVSIKWPNDIFLGSEKVCGILIRNFLQKAQLRASIVGVGLNVNQTEFGEITGATSMAIVKGESLDLQQIRNAIFHQFSSIYDLGKSEPDQISATYQQLLYQKDIWAAFADHRGKFTGRIIGVNEMGALQIQLGDSTIKTYETKEIQYL